jgi:hypothetical protein
MLKNIINEILDLFRTLSGVIFILIFFGVIFGIQALPLSRYLAGNLSFLFFCLFYLFVLKPLFDEKYNFSNFSFRSFIDIIFKNKFKPTPWSVIFTIATAFSVATLLIFLIKGRV